MGRHATRWIPVLCVTLVAASCGGAEGEDATTALEATTQSTTASTAALSSPTASTTNASTTSTTVADSAIALPATGEPWDLLFFGFDDVFTELTAELYAEEAAMALGTEVRLSRPAGFDHIWAAMMLEQLRGDRYPPLGEMVPPAEIIVLVSRPGERSDGADQNIVEDFERCWWGRGAQGESPLTDLPSDYWDLYRSDLSAVYSELWDLRQGTPTVLITIDLYNPSLPAQRETEIDSECIAWFEAWSEVIAEEAESGGSLVVSLHDLFNGPDHDLDPAASGYIASTANDEFRWWYRVTPEGAALIAQALAEAGFEPVARSE